ncbi:hepatitis A virus cellular receptor 1-like [Megalobrama amblycephala]|uniref:hepatitis A virus cellular receptor 1-like n=1 Tax=Megalobrama amblycephala TaxID=75352 RepID=UPI002013CC2C|nr:hepatitis A virus cellular receptor 1-like [Megalobrama amblycephala]
MISQIYCVSGISGVDETHVFNSSGENVRLSCNNALPDCKSTTWTYSNRSTHSAVELINGGIKKKDTERHERLSLGSDCSLNINKVKKKKDYGFYSCQQYVNGQKQGTDAYVYLHVLHVSVSPSSSSSSSSQTEISPGRSVTLSCQLYSYDGFSCDYWVRSEGLHLLWVNQAGVDLKTDSRYQISSDHCIITLTTTLLNEDDNREWRCQLTLRNQLQTSVRYTVKYSVSSSNSEKKSSQTTAAAPTQVVPSTTASTLTPTSLVVPSTTASTPTPTSLASTTITALIPDVTSNSLDPATTSTTQIPASPVVPSTTASTLTPTSLVIVIVVASFAVLLPALILWMIRRKRDDNRRGTDDSEDQQTRPVYPTGQNTLPQQEQTDDHVTYSEVTAYSKNQDQKKKVRCDDKVTYASIRGAKAGSQENCSELYASVNKNHHKSVK